MSYSISGSGHNANAEKVQEAFSAFVKAIDAATEVGGEQFSGSISGSELGEDGWSSFNLTAVQAREYATQAVANDVEVGAAEASTDDGGDGQPLAGAESTGPSEADGA